MIELFLVGLGGSCGALSRYALSVFINKRVTGSFPLATFIINVAGSFLIGFFISKNLGENLFLLLGTGLMGGFTTYSTFGIETVNLLKMKKYLLFSLYMLTSVVICGVSAFAGFMFH